MEEAEISILEVILRCFLHGILFSSLYFVLWIVWEVLFVILTFVSLVIGFIIGLFVLCLLIGFLNSILTELIWDISIKSDWQSLLAHGFVLLIVLLIASIPTQLIRLESPNLAIVISSFIVDCFVYGFIAQFLAENWIEEEIYMESSE